MVVHFTVNFGNFVGTYGEYEIDVPDDATEDEIECAVQEEFENIISDECSYEITEIEKEVN